MPNLFDFGIHSGYVDRYSGVNNHQKFKSMNTRAIVEMSLDRFAPFTKARRLKRPTKTIISNGENSIKDSVEHAGISMSMAADKSTRSIVINKEVLAEQMDMYPANEHKEYFDSRIRYAYNTISHIARKSEFMKNYLDDINNGLISEDYMSLLDTVYDMALGRISKCELNQSFSETIFKEAVDSNDNLKTLADNLYNGRKLSNFDSIKKSGLTIMENELGNIVEFDKSLGVTNNSFCFNDSTIPTLKIFNNESENPSNKNESISACEVGNDSVSYDDTPTFSEDKNTKDTDYQINDDTLEADKKAESDDKYFFTRRGYEDEINFDSLDPLVSALYESLVGREGRISSQQPSKKLNKRNVASGLSENIYVSKTPNNGKKLNINVLIDTSGSMSGAFIDDAVNILYVFNQLARKGVVSGKIMLSCSKASGMWDFPMSQDNLSKIASHNNGEGFRHTMAIRWKELQEADFNVAITDGKLTDGYIDLAEFESHNIFVTGMYVKRNMNKSQILSYTNGLNKWFSKSIVRSSASECIYAIVDSAILQLGKGGK